MGNNSNRYDWCDVLDRIIKPMECQHKAHLHFHLGTGSVSGGTAVHLLLNLCHARHLQNNTHVTQYTRSNKHEHARETLP